MRTPGLPEVPYRQVRCIQLARWKEWQSGGRSFHLSSGVISEKLHQSFLLQNGAFTTNNGASCLEVKDGSTDDGTLVQIADCVDGNENQQWYYTSSDNMFVTFFFLSFLDWLTMGDVRIGFDGRSRESAFS